jgi:hypothetical protein
MFSKWSASSASAFGDELARRFAQRYPPALDQAEAPQISANRLARILESLYAEAQAFHTEHKLGWYRQARLAHAFKWRLIELGYSQPLIEAATEGLVVYLRKPRIESPELAKALEKRKAKQAKALRAEQERAAETASGQVQYSRANPSPRYQALIRLYRQMHEEGERFLGIPAEETFPGQSLPPQAARIKRLIVDSRAKRILDYGSGKGQQYSLRDVVLPAAEGRWPSIQAYWGVDAIKCYDPAYPPYADLPTGAYDGVICTDVLEHCPEEDIPWILDELFSYARKFVFANVACYLAKKRLPTGENAHCTIRPKTWWVEQFNQAARRHPDVKYEVWIQQKDREGKIIDEVIRG